jgi:hypothetical protein
MGAAINHIVTPLPLGAIIAPKITKINAAYRKFFRQNFESINPVNEIPYIIIGNLIFFVCLPIAGELKPNIFNNDRY